MRKYLSIDCQETPSDLNGIRVDPSRILVRRMQVEAETDKSKPKTAALGSKLPNRPLDGVGGATTLLSPSGNVTLRWNFQFFSFSLGHFIFPSIPLFIHFFFGVLRRFPISNRPLVPLGPLLSRICSSQKKKTKCRRSKHFLERCWRWWRRRGPRQGRFFFFSEISPEPSTVQKKRKKCFSSKRAVGMLFFFRQNGGRQYCFFSDDDAPVVAVVAVGSVTDLSLSLCVSVCVSLCRFLTVCDSGRRIRSTEHLHFACLRYGRVTGAAAVVVTSVDLDVGHGE